MLQEIYRHCTSITIQPYNANAPEGSVRIMADVCVKSPSGNFEYAKINVLKYPRPSERDQMLMDAMLFIAERLRVRVEYEKSLLPR